MVVPNSIEISYNPYNGLRAGKGRGCKPTPKHVQK